MSTTVRHKSSARRIIPQRIRNFGRIKDDFSIPDLTKIQTISYDRFLQADLPPDKRQDVGLESVLREIFPIENHDKTIRLELYATNSASSDTTKMNAANFDSPMVDH